jgi:hypothetical protein
MSVEVTIEYWPHRQGRPCRIELEVPAEYAYLSLGGIGERLRLDVQGETPRFISR